MRLKSIWSSAAWSDSFWWLKKHQDQTTGNTNLKERTICISFMLNNKSFSHFIGIQHLIVSKLTNCLTWNYQNIYNFKAWASELQHKLWTLLYSCILTLMNDDFLWNGGRKTICQSNMHNDIKVYLISK